MGSNKTIIELEFPVSMWYGERGRSVKEAQADLRKDVDALEGVREWLDDKESGGSSELTIEQYSIHINHLCKTMKIRDPTKITYKLVKEYHNKLFKGGVGFKVRRGILSAICSFLRSDIVDKSDIAEKIKNLRPSKRGIYEKKPKPKKDIPDYPRAIERMNTLISSLYPKHKALLTLFTKFGVRVEEAVNLNVEHFDPDTVSLHVIHGKGGKDRDIEAPIGYEDIIRDAIQGYLNTRVDLSPSDPLIPSREGKRYEKKGLAGTIRSILKREFGSMGPHALRHYYASWMVTLRDEKGDILYSVIDVRDMLGHTNVMTTSTYLHKFARVNGNNGNNQIPEEAPTVFTKLDKAINEVQQRSILVSARETGEITPEKYKELLQDLGLSK